MGLTVKEAKFFNGNISMYLEGNKLFVKFPTGTIVDVDQSPQEEYLVIIDELLNKLIPFGFVEPIQPRKKANTEKLLNPDELLISGMYTFGYFFRENIKNVPIYLQSGNILENLEYEYNETTGNIKEYQTEKINIKWYPFEQVIRISSAILSDDIDSFLNAVFRTYYDKYKSFSDVDSKYIFIQKFKDKYYRDLGKSFGTIVNLDLVKDLGQYLKIDISIVEIKENNLLPLYTKYNNFDRAIIIGKTKSGYEIIALQRQNGIILQFSDKGQDKILIMLVVATRLKMVKVDTITINVKRVETILNNISNNEIIVENITNMIKDQA